jgi:hypothetical protein
MKLLVYTWSNDANNPGQVHLINSLKKFGYDYKIAPAPPVGFSGNNHPLIVDWLKQVQGDYTHFLYTDAWDTIAVAGPDELMRNYMAIKLPLVETGDVWLYSAEKNCYPRADWAHLFNPVSRWPYLNSGGYIAPFNLYFKTLENNVRPHQDGQEWGAHTFTRNNPGNIILDTGCQIFQTLYNNNDLHQPPNWGEFAICENGRFHNLITGTKPIFIHGNGKVDMRSIYHSKYLS